MTQVVHPGVRSADRCCQLLEVIVYGLGMQMSAELIGEYKSGPPLFFIFPPLPFREQMAAYQEMADRTAPPPNGQRPRRTGRGDSPLDTVSRAAGV